MKKIVLFLVFINIIILINIFNINNTSNKIVNSNNYLAVNVDSYVKNYDYSFVKNTNNYKANNKDDILNIIYSTLNNGYNVNSFKCSYDCSKDIIDILNDNSTLIAINNLVNPFNSFDTISINYVKNNEYKIMINKLYNDNEIDMINKYLDIITSKLLNNNMSNEEKILVIHDYIISNTTYKDSSNANKASNIILNKEAVCSGYSDLMTMFLDRLDIPNIKVINNNHVWNVVYINNEWKHLDLTFDDYNDELSRNYFLVSTNTLKNYKNNNHSFNKYIYSELV